MWERTRILRVFEGECNWSVVWCYSSLVHSFGSQVMDRLRMALVLLSASIPLLVFPSKPSTDFEVHRHWKALVFNLPLSQWYTDQSSKWTLDYPPLFAYFEYVLANLLHPLDPGITDFQNHNYQSTRCLYLMRTTVLVVHILYIYAVLHLSHTLNSPPKVLALALLLPALTIVDQIHFQYNTLPLSFLLLTISHLLRNHPLRACIFFSLCLNFKHTFLPLTPVISLHILHLIRTHPRPRITFLQCAFRTLTIFIVIFLPFFSQLQILFTRLFPVSRGLLHATWAPNVWALFATMDLVLRRVFRISGPSLTSGHIYTTAPFSILPNPTPFHCLILTTISIIPSLIVHYHRLSPQTLLLSLSISSLSAYMFGWHVHEKAIIPCLLPLIFLNTDLYGLMSMGGQYALMELVRRPAESLVALPFYVSHHWFLGKRWYLYGVGVVELLAGAAAGGWLWGQKWEYMPRILVCMYCFLGVGLGYIRLQWEVYRQWRGKEEAKCD